LFSEIQGEEEDYGKVEFAHPYKQLLIYSILLHR